MVVIPYKSGDTLDFSFGFVLDYAIAQSENMNIVFSPSTPIEGQFSLVGEPHPISGRRGAFYRSRDGSPLALLRGAVSDYLTAYPDGGAVTPPVTTGGVLAAGVWDDNGTWNDNQNWSDT